MKTSLIVGGTRGIGKATADLLKSKNWNVISWGGNDYNVHRFMRIPPAASLFSLDAFVFSAGSILDTYDDAFDFPLAFWYLISEDKIHFMDNAVIVAVSSVAAGRPAEFNAHYGAAKAALEHYATTIQFSDKAALKRWKVYAPRFDIVTTDMSKLLPADSLIGRNVITPQEAAEHIVARIEQ